MTHSEHEKTLINLMDQAGIVVNTSPAPYIIREGWNAAHYSFNVYSTKAHGGVHHTGIYSMGWGHFKVTDLPRFKRYGGDNNPPRDQKEAFWLLTNGRDDCLVVQDIRSHANNKGKPEPVQVFWSLLSDSHSADQDFSIWADDLGYSDDSIKAKTMWEECKDTRRFLESILPNETLAAMYDIASEI